MIQDWQINSVQTSMGIKYYAVNKVEKREIDLGTQATYYDALEQLDNVLHNDRLYEDWK